ncbi:plasmid mobilization protein [Billgrantia aerodenitrificans]|uniref:Plasmid mobilization relaxosome protein MobC n=1 Tax=Billgrantia aerodenitrificans TaxID=2733483 RepID=A0ABS9AVZ9_9GAMM|nr:plasmid mobilization relaxosome protein MobC [Halomonas aerodenitrificans]MCE8026075.1 plasmid mobilization relaxosome protein MobC [Halomonas aerodenitrificans]
MKAEKRTKIVKSRFNETEIELLRANANGEPLGAFLRNVGLANTIKEVFKIKKVYTPVDPDLISELQKLGINLNQIARKVNQDSKAGKSLEILQVLSELSKITESINEIKEAHSYDRKVF